MIAQLDNVPNGLTAERHANRLRGQAAYRRRKHDRAIAAGEVSIKRYAVRNDQKPAGLRAMAIEIVDKAIEDYYILVRSGAIKNGKPTGKWYSTHNNKLHHNGLTPVDMHELLAFFQNGACQLIFDLADADWSAKALFRRMVELERGQAFREVITQGVRSDDCADDGQNVVASMMVAG